MAVRPDDLRELIGLRTADHGELDWLIMFLEEVSDVGSVRDRVDVHFGIAPFPLVHLVLESVAQCLGTGLPVAKSKSWA